MKIKTKCFECSRAATRKHFYKNGYKKNHYCDRCYKNLKQMGVLRD